MRRHPSLVAQLVRSNPRSAIALAVFVVALALLPSVARSTVSWNGSRVFAVKATATDGKTASATATVSNQVVTLSVAQSVSDGQRVSGSLLWSATTSGKTVSKVEFTVNGALVATEYNAPYEITLDTKSVANGVYPFAVKAFATDGSTAAASASVTVSNAVVAPLSVQQNVGDGQTVAGTLDWVAELKGKAVKRVVFSVDGSKVAIEYHAPYRISYDTRKLADGKHAFAVKAYAVDGSTTEAAATAMVANQSPAPAASQAFAVSQSVASGQTLTGTVKWTASPAGKTVDRVEFLIDGRLLWTERYSPYVYAGDAGALDTRSLTNGSHTLAVKAYATDGTSGSASAAVLISNGSSSTASATTSSSSTTSATATTSTTSTPPSPTASQPPAGSDGSVHDVYAGQSIDAAIEAAAGGDTIRIHAGNYSQLTISRSFSTPVNVVGEPGAVIAGIVLSGASGFVFDRITSVVPATGTCCNSSAFYVNGTTSRIVLRNSTLRGGFITLKQYAAYPVWSRDVTIINNDIAGGGGDLIHVNGADGIAIEHNVLHDPQMLGTEHHDGFQVQRANNWSFVRNSLRWDTIPKGWGPNQAIMVTQGASTDTITNGVIANNLVAHWHGGRPLIISNTKGPLQVVNNTFVDSGDGIGITVTGNNGPVSGVEIWNNVAQSVYVENGASISLLDTNLYTESSRGNVQGANARTGDPLFVDGAGYLMSASSPAVGTSLSRSGTPSVYIDGSTRSTPSLGATRIAG